MLYPEGGTGNGRDVSIGSFLGWGGGYGYRLSYRHRERDFRSTFECETQFKKR